MKRLSLQFFLPIVAFLAITQNASAQWTGSTTLTTTLSNVGVGTIAPTQKLQVVDGNVLLDYTNGSTTGNLFLGGVTYPANQNGMRLSYFNSAGTGFKNGYIDVRTVGGTANDGLLFRVDNTLAPGTERMRICANGRVAIGLNAPTTIFHVASASSNDGIRMTQTGTTAATLSLIGGAGGTGGKNWALHSTGSGNTQGAGHLLFWDWTANVERMRITSAGDVGIGATVNPAPGTYRLFVGGSTHIAGGLFVVSDSRFKKDVRPLEGALAKIGHLQGVQYAYRQSEFPDRGFLVGRTDGFIAQDLREVLPELVQQGTDGYLAVNYLGVIPVLTEAIKELQAEKDQQIAEKDRQIAALEARLARLEAAFDRAATPAVEGQDFLLSNQPNPFSGTTTVQCTIPATVRTAVLVITDLTGREITRQTLTGRGQTSTDIDLRTAPNGTYVGTLVADGKAVGSLKLMVSGK